MYVICLLVLAGLFLPAQSSVAEIQKQIPLDKEKSLKVEIRFGAGTLNISKGDDDLVLDGEFQYENQDLVPRIEYEVLDDVGELELGMGGEASSVRDAKSRWDLRFTGQIPLDLEAKVGACEGVLDLTGLRVASLDIETGASDLALAFSTRNEVVLRRAEVKAGAARFRATGLGYANLKSMSFEGGVGSYTLDFSGPLQRRGEVKIDMGVGALALRIPRETSARIEAPGGFLAYVDAESFQRDGNIYLSPGYREDKPTLRISIDAAICSITVETVP